MDINTDWLAQVSFNSDGLIPAIAQDDATGRVLMMAWMTKLTLEQTVKTGKAVYWSRSRGQPWHKGETSGHEQNVKAVQLDCDGEVFRHSSKPKVSPQILKHPHYIPHRVNCSLFGESG